MTHYISPAPLTFETIDAILNKHYTLALSDESKQLINDCKAYLDHKIETSENPLYGITTGFGSLCKISISHDDLSQLQANLVMSHACSVGNPIQQDIIRLMLLLKAHALSLGKSGVQLATVDRIIDMFNHDVMPVVRELGSTSSCPSSGKAKYGTKAKSTPQKKSTRNSIGSPSAWEQKKVWHC